MAADGRLGAVTVPVVVVRGTRDRLCPQDRPRGWPHRRPRGRLVELVGVAHMTPQTDPKEVAALLRSLYD